MYYYKTFIKIKQIQVSLTDSEKILINLLTQKLSQVIKNR
jgi:hypothetical protein